MQVITRELWKRLYIGQISKKPLPNLQSQNLAQDLNNAKSWWCKTKNENEVTTMQQCINSKYILVRHCENWDTFDFCELFKFQK